MLCFWCLVLASPPSFLHMDLAKFLPLEQAPTCLCLPGNLPITLAFDLKNFVPPLLRAQHARPPPTCSAFANAGGL